MVFDHYAFLAEESACPVGVDPSALASGTVDGCTQQFASAALLADATERGLRKTRATRCYQDRATALEDLALPAELRLDEPPAHLLPGWLAIQLDFELKAPWYSKDDRRLHVLDNPVRKDRVFGVPFMSAASWKGLLRWSCRMEHGLVDYLDEHHGKVDDWSDPPWIVHLFGSAKSEKENFSRGALQCFPTWFDKVGFEVINPHDRARRAGTWPIVYEVVPPGCRATLRLLYAPAPRRIETPEIRPSDVVGRLLDATQKLLTVYGFSGKRTAGWGIAEILRGEISSASGSKNGTVDDLKTALREFNGPRGERA